MIVQQKPQITANEHAAWSIVISFALIAVYLLGAFQSSTIHHFVHSEASELHSQQNESDACHQAIYHDSKQGCGHKLHISSSEKCSMCHLVFHSEHVLPHNIFTLVDAGYDTGIPSLCSLTLDDDAVSLPARAPPVA
jgi:hypothetical protein